MRFATFAIAILASVGTAEAAAKCSTVNICKDGYAVKTGDPACNSDPCVIGAIDVGLCCDDKKSTCDAGAFQTGGSGTDGVGTCVCDAGKIFESLLLWSITQQETLHN